VKISLKHNLGYAFAEADKRMYEVKAAKKTGITAVKWAVCISVKPLGLIVIINKNNYE
jgi:hypothetical protein